MDTYTRYQELLLPPWAPPAWIFGPVWTALYIIIAMSFGKVLVMFFKKEITFLTLLPFILNIIFNLAFTPIQFGLKNNLLASIDIILVFITLIWAIIAIQNYSKWIAYIQIPYFLWVSFATTLQLTITYINY